MPPRAAPGDRARVEEALGPDLRAVLWYLCELFELDPCGWQRTPLQPPFETAAVLKAAARLKAEAELSNEDALNAAAADLGIPPATIQTRTERWYRDSRRGFS